MVDWSDIPNHGLGLGATEGSVDSDHCSRYLEALHNALQTPADLRQPSHAPELRVLVEKARAACEREASSIERLRESEERWRSIATNPFDFVTVVDADTVFQYVNRAVPWLRPEDLVGRASIYDWTAPEYHATIRKTVREVFETGKPGYYEAYSPMVPAWFGGVVGPIVRDGKVVALSVQARDITAHKQAELALRDSEERFRQLAESIKDVFFLIEPAAGRVLYTSPAYEELWGRSLAAAYEDMGEWMRGLHPEDRPVLEESFAAMIATCRGETSEFAFGQPVTMRIVRPDGTLRHARVRLFAVRDDWGRVQRVAGVITDVTERVEAEMKLAAAEQRFRTLVEELPVIAYIVGIEESMRLHYISPQIESKLGFPVQAWYDPEFWPTRVHADDRDRVTAAIEALLAGGDQPALRYRLIAADGTPLWFHDEAVRIRAADGSVLMQGVLLDVTEAEVARAAQQQTRAGASHLVEVQEGERRRIARELHDEVGQTLTSLNFMLQSARERPGEHTRALDEARVLVGELLERVRNLSLELRPSMLDDLGLLPTLLWLFERYGKQMHVHVRFEHRGLDGRFGTELETAAFRIVQESLTNVARHAKVQEVDVRAACDRKVLSLQIEDAGVGFDVNSPSTARSSGLAGMRERVALLGGEFFVDSRPGGGTHISVRLPVVGGPLVPRATGRAEP